MPMVKYRTVVEREGEDCGPIDWTHELAKAKPTEWREAEQNPEGFTYSEYGREIIALRMYDGWPYWKPMPSVLTMGPLGAEWHQFNSYGASINRKRTHPSHGSTAYCPSRREEDD